MFRFNDRIDLAPALYTGSPNVRVLPTGPRSNRLRAFWLQPISVFGWSMLTMSTAVHICWACRPV